MSVAATEARWSDHALPWLNKVFTTPDKDVGRDGMDFGKGFYLTPNLDTARKMAVRVAKANGGEPVVLKFSFDEALARARVLVRDYPNLDRTWVNFILANRMGNADAADHNMDARYPTVHGHIADDRLMRIIDDYENGDLTIEEVEHKLAVAPFRAFQYSFHTDEALSFLHYEGVEP